MAITSSFALKLACMALVCMALASAPRGAAMSCGQVATFVAPCIPYLRSNGGSVPATCCSGVKSLNTAASTTSERQSVCHCLLNAAGTIPDMNADLVAGLPAACGVSLPFKITTSTNCNSIR